MAARRRAGSFSPKTSRRLRISKVEMLYDMVCLLSPSVTRLHQDVSGSIGKIAAKHRESAPCSSSSLSFRHAGKQHSQTLTHCRVSEHGVSQERVRLACKHCHL